MSASAPIVSVVLPTFNRADRLPAAIESVLRQSHRDLELIVVDDASTDDTLERLRTIEDPRLIVETLPTNRGGGAARNAGIRRARGTWVAFQDSDDDWHADKLERQLARLRDRPTAAAVYCRYRRGESIVPSDDTLPEGDITVELARRSFIGTPTLIARRAALLEIGGFDDDLRRLQDWELMLRLADGREVTAVDAVLVDAGDVGAGSVTAGHDRPLLHAERAIVERHRTRFRAAGVDVLAERLWHLGHVATMSGAADEGRRHFAEARSLADRPRYRLSSLLARHPLLYTHCYAAFRRFV